MHQAGVPAGVFNMVNGDGPGVGQQLSTHEDIAMISFTGSTRAGRLISKAAAETLKQVRLELGGKGANVVFADAADNAVEKGVRHCMNNSGQSCNAPTRMLVEASRYDAAVAEATEAAASIKVGPTTEAGRHMGPVVNKTQWKKIQGMIQVGIDEGARMTTGGTGLPENMNRGFYVKPTIFADVTNDMRIAQEEIFGPVLVMIPFKDEADAIRIANDTPYGLTNYVQSTDGPKRNRMARALKAGMIEMNHQSRGNGAPFGGIKLSGLAREGGVWGIEEYLVSKSISGWD
jgi:aldehyde dehydrogenase (NAD+)